MSDYNRSTTPSPFGPAISRTGVAIDEGLRAYMLHVYNYMVLGLAIPGLERDRVGLNRVGILESTAF
jgi:uncharacterized protein